MKLLTLIFCLLAQAKKSKKIKIKSETFRVKPNKVRPPPNYLPQLQDHGLNNTIAFEREEFLNGNEN